jgi:Pyruvate/2-oxoacid:ferredoxin oxidoreductase gamma subunit
MVLLGALAATDSLPIPTDTILTVVRTQTKEKFLASNLKAFELGAAAARNTGNWQRRSVR